MKRPYRIPLIAELPPADDSAPKVISLFAGGGGSSLGYRMAGCRVVYANEFIASAVATYKANCPVYTFVDNRNIRQINPEEISQIIGISKGELDILDGSPPCSSFSTAGKREKNWGKEKQYSNTAQRTDDLFFEYIRIVKGIQPKVFVAENVPGLVKGTAKGVFLQILDNLDKAGYNVSCRLVAADALGVPQKRLRTIFIGVRKDLDVKPSHPKPYSYKYTLKDAIPWVDGKTNNPFAVEPETDISTYAIAAEYEKMKKPGTTSRKYFQLIRPALNEPCNSLVFAAGSKSSAGVVHPVEKRRFSIAEMKRICGFPDDYVLCGTYVEQWERLSRAVPPPMMNAIATHIRTEILK